MREAEKFDLATNEHSGMKAGRSDSVILDHLKLRVNFSAELSRSDLTQRPRFLILE